MESVSSASKIRDEYTILKDTYRDFANRLKNLIGDILTLEEKRFLPIEAREKELDSLKAKVEQSQGKIQYLEQISDLAGIRVITFTYDDIDAIEIILKREFSVHEIDKTDSRLGVDQMGYRSRHLIISLPEERLKLPEFARYKNLKAEVQIRTLLAHAWAQTSHDQIYKPSSILPPKIKRDFNLVSGLLEIADNEFNRISQEIEKYQKTASSRTASGDLDQSIDSITLREYLASRFSHLSNLDPRFGPSDARAEEVIEELNSFGISTIKELDALTSNPAIEKYENTEDYTNFLGLTRTILIVSDAEKYFEKAWKNKWSMSEASAKKYLNLGIDLKEIYKAHPSLGMWG